MLRIKGFKKFICVLLSILFVLSNIVYADTSGTASMKYSDIQGNKFETTIREWIANGLVNGYPDNTFRPDNSINRAEFMAMVNRSFGFMERTEINFSDVSRDKWFYNDVAKAVKAGYMQGSGGKITPANPITRQEFAVVLARLTNNQSTMHQDELNVLADADKIPDWSKAAVSVALKNGYFDGFVSKSFNPTEKATRQEVVVALDRAYKSLYKAVYNSKGTFGPASGMQVLEGSAVVVSPDVTLKNTTINGDLILRETIGEGNVYLDNVVVKGTTIVKGGGAHSIVISNSSLGKVIVRKEGNIVRIVATGSTTIGDVDMQSGATLHEEFLTGDGFGDVTIPDDILNGATIVLEGVFDSIKVDSNNANINVGSGTIGSMTLAPEASGTTVNVSQQASIGTLNINAAANITGQGTVQTANVNAQGATMQQQPQRTNLAPGVSLGSTPTQTPSPTPTPTPAPSSVSNGNGRGNGGHNGNNDDDSQDKANKEAALAVTVKIANLPGVGAIKLSDKPLVVAARAAYEALTSVQKELVSNLNKLVVTETKISELEAAQAYAVLKASVETKVAAYEALANGNLATQALIDAANAAKLLISLDGLNTADKAAFNTRIAAADAKVAAAQKIITDNNTAANAVIAKIAALPTASALTLADESAVEAARAAYEALTAVQKAMVTNLSKLTAAEARIAEMAGVSNLDEFKAAIDNLAITDIYITASFNTNEKILVDRPVTINGENNTITFTGDTAGWQGNYVLHVYNTTGVTIKNVKLSGGDAGLLVNGSTVVLEGDIDVSGNEFGGIEAGKGSGLTTDPELTVTNADFVNTTEAYGKPTLWEDGVNNCITGFTGTKIQKGTQPQYYLDSANSKYNLTGDEALAYVVPENFNTNADSNYMGINVGFRLESLTLADLGSVEISLYKDSTVLAKNTSIISKFITLPTETKQFSAPFIVQSGSYTEEYWTFDSNILTKTVKPNRAVIKITDKNGNTYTVENNNLVEPNGVSYVRLFARNYTGNDALAKVQPLDFSAGKWSTVSGYNVGFNLLMDTADVESIEVSLHKGNSVLSANTATPALLTLGTNLSSPFNVNGSFTGDEYWSYGGWNAPVTSVPDMAVIKVTDKEGNTYTVENHSLAGDPSMIYTFAGEAALKYVVPENFNTHSGTDYKGINVGFRLEALNVSDLGNVEVSLYNGSTLLVTNSANAEFMKLNDSNKQHSTPFMIQQGTYREQYWNLGGQSLNTGIKPDRAQIKITDKAGYVYVVENANLVEPNGATYESLFIVDKTPVEVSNADRIYHELWGSITAGTTNQSKYTDVEVKFSEDFHMSIGDVIVSYWTKDNNGEYMEIKGTDGKTVVKSKLWGGYLTDIEANTKVTDLIKAGTIYGTAINSTSGGSAYATQAWWDALWAARDSGQGVWVKFVVTDDWGNTSTTYAPIAGEFDLPMAIKAEVPKFIVDEQAEFTVSTVANDDAGKLVRAYFTLPAEANVEYYEVNNGNWYTLNNEYGPAGGFPVADATSRFRATFNAAGTFTVKVEFKDIEDNVLGSKDIAITAEADETAPQISNAKLEVDNGLIVEFGINEAIDLSKQAANVEISYFRNGSPINNTMFNIPLVKNKLWDGYLWDKERGVNYSKGLANAGYSDQIPANAVLQSMVRQGYHQNGDMNYVNIDWTKPATYTVQIKVTDNHGNVSVIKEVEAVVGETAAYVESPLSDWIVDRTEPKAWDINNDWITLTTKTEPNNNWYAWQGKKTATNNLLTNHWKVETEVALTDELLARNGVRTSMWLNVENSAGENLDWTILQFKIDNATGTKGWQWWNSNEPGTWENISGIPTTAGTYDLEVYFDDGKITQFINGTKVNEYSVGEDGLSSVKEVIVQSYSFGEEYTTTWKVPTIKNIEQAATYVRNETELRSALADLELSEIKLACAFPINNTVTIERAVSIDGNNKTITGPAVGHGIEVLADDVVISNLTVTGSGRSNLHFYKAAGGELTNVTLSNAKNAGMIVNGSEVVAYNLNTNGNTWGGVNVDPGVGVATASVFALNGGTLEEATQIWSDGRNISESATVTVNAEGYTAYALGGTVAGFVWSNKGLNNAASITRNVNGTARTALYPTIQAAVAAAENGDTVDVAPGNYTITVTINIDKAITVKGAANFATKIITTGGNPVFNLSSAATIDSIFISKEDTLNQHLVKMTANGATVKDSKFIGKYTIGAPEVVRAIVPNAGVTGYTISGNYFESVRQPAYLEGAGNVINNFVKNTKGWVVCVNHPVTFVGNTFEGNVVDIAIIANNQTQSEYYTDIVNISKINNGAHVENQLLKASAKKGYLVVEAGGNEYINSIQNAIDAAQAGDTIDIGEGTFVEQLDIRKNITLNGTGSTFIQAPDSLASKFDTTFPYSSTNKPVMFITDAAPTIDHMIIDGAGKGNANNRIIGIGIYNGGGNINNVRVKNMKNTPFNGVQNGVGIYAYNSDGSERHLTVSNCYVHDYQKNGMVFSGEGLTVNVIGNKVEGAGKTDLIAQNGIQVSVGAAGTVEHNTIRGNWYVGNANAASTGILVYDSQDVVVQNNTLENCQNGIDRYDSTADTETAYYIIPENFNTHSGDDYKGINVGFRLSDDLNISDLDKVEISLYNADNKLVSNTTNDKFKTLTDDAKQHSTPFIIQNGAYVEEYWHLGTEKLDMDTRPSAALITAYDKDGNSYTVENNNFVEPDGVSYESLFTDDRIQIVDRWAPDGYWFVIKPEQYNTTAANVYGKLYDSRNGSVIGNVLTFNRNEDNAPLEAIYHNILPIGEYEIKLFSDESCTEYLKTGKFFVSPMPHIVSDNFGGTTDSDTITISGYISNYDSTQTNSLEYWIDDSGSTAVAISDNGEFNFTTGLMPGENELHLLYEFTYSETEGSYEAYSYISYTNGDETEPEFQGALVSGNLLILEYDEGLNDELIPDTGDFAITVNNAQAVCESIDVFGNIVEICFSTDAPITGSDDVSFTYTVGDAPLADYAGNEAAGLVEVSANNITPAVDSYEASELGDDNGNPVQDYYAVPISIDGTLQHHTLAPAGDVDQLYFDVAETDVSKTFRIETSGGSEYMDTHIYIFLDGQQIAEDEDGGEGWASLVEFTPTAAGRYFVYVEHYYPLRGACAYDISVSIEGQEQANETLQANVLMAEGLQADNAKEPIAVDFDVERHEREPKTEQ